MKYYTLTTTDDLEIIGSYPQVSNTDKNLFGSPFSTKKVIYGEIPEEIPYLEVALDSKANKTDLLNSFNPSFGILVSEKFRATVEGFKIQHHRFYPIKLIENGEYVNGYYWFYCYENMFQYIDMKKSEFSIQKNGKEIICSFHSEAFYNEKKTECLWDFEATFKIKKIHFLKTFPNYDFFEFENRISISKDLINEFEKKNVTGFEFSELGYEIEIN